MAEPLTVDPAAEAARGFLPRLAGQRIVEPGEIVLSAGLSLAERTAPATVVIDGPLRTVTGSRVLRTPVRVRMRWRRG